MALRTFNLKTGEIRRAQMYVLPVLATDAK